MKKLIVIILFLFGAELCKSQDLILTTNNDSLNCQIIEKKGSFLIYKIKVEDAYQSRAVKEEFVLKYEVGYYLKNNKNNASGNSAKSEKVKNFNEGVFMVIGFNRSQLLELYANGTPSELKDYANDLMNSISFNAEVDAFISKKFSLGLRYELYKSDASKNNLATAGPSNTYYFDLEEDLVIHTISPKLNFRTTFIDEKNPIILSAMVDYNILNNLFSIEEDGGSYKASGDMKGQKIGLSIAASYERVINNDLKIGFTTMFKTCSLDKVKINGVDQTLVGNNQLNINRLNIGVFLAFR